ncbi:MAG: tetratricopeptide repeat protein [Candidatus Puniceispirillaceae bacterium]
MKKEAFHFPYLAYVKTMRNRYRSFMMIACLSLTLGISAPMADSRDIVLDGLFTSLQETNDAGDAMRLVSEIWSRWATHPTDDSLTNRLGRGIEMMNQGDFVHAEAIFTDIITEDPNFAEAWNRRATLYYIQGELSKSRADIANTLALEPRHFGALSGLGMIEYALGNYEGALRAYEQAVEVNPHMARADQMIKDLSEKLRGMAL